MAFFRKLFRRNSAEEPSQTAVVTAEPPPAASAPTAGAEVATGAAVENVPAPEVSAPLGPTAPLEALPAGLPSHAALEQKLQDELDADDGTRQLEVPAVPTHNVSRGLAAWAGRDIGRVRQINQDHVLAALMNLPRASGDIPMGLFIVADGMGGHTGGEIASRLAVETVLVSVLEQLVLPAMAEEEPGSALQTLMITAVQEANTRIWETASEAGTDMGTTCTAVLYMGHNVYIGHVGDSRAYLLMGGQLRQLTSDHSAVGRLIQLGQITPDEALHHPLRNQLYRSIGQHPEVQVDFHTQSLESASHLLLCSDGLWGMVPDAEMAAIIDEAHWPEEASRRLIARANMLGGEDNISAVVISLPSEVTAP
jgi:serine/threonine protein phosphatase PrpC